MACKYPSVAYAATSCQAQRQQSIFDLPADFFDSCRLLPSSSSTALESLSISESDKDSLENQTRSGVAVPRLTCNTCKAKFESLQDQRSHFKSEIHRFNVKLKIAGKDIVKEEDVDELGADEVAAPRNDAHKSSIGNTRQKLFIRLKTGERVSIWKSLILNASESVSYEKNNNKQVGGNLREIERLKSSIREDRDDLRIVLLSTGGHFAGCVFDRNSVVAQKTFHRYVVRAKAGKKQSSKDGTGKAPHSAGAALRRYNERALKKEVQDLLAAWKPYFDASSCVFIHAPSTNRHMLFDGDKPRFSHRFCSVGNVPFTVGRPTINEAKRVYTLLTQVSFQVEESETPSGTQEEEDLLSSSSTDDDTESQDSCDQEEYWGHNLNCRDDSCFTQPFNPWKICCC
ncbi:hypothetical protein COLO4_05508 [Corchorus olitorius]|uniref:VLRF1 domain-containing protein n=1 Tax=Corchorus olitorius TaxID=93759 RepID=A0A1R3KQN4_9ROSI|nr:hypothetical protein COLO4_05508 [Corchorus olitorius]